MCAALSASRSSRAAVFADWRAARLSLGCPAFSTFLSPYDPLPCAVVDGVGLGAGMKEPREKRVSVNGVSLCYFEWGERVAGAPSTLLVHATGFHGRLWDQSVKQFSGPVAGHIVAIDMRGHGRSDKTPPFNWDSFGSDVVAFVESLDLHNIVAAGHSMGGHCIVQAAARVPARFARLVLIDPVILSPEAYEQRANYVGAPTASEHPTAKRRNQWRDATQMFEHFKARMPFVNWQPEVLRDYCNWGIVPAAQGEGEGEEGKREGFVLACPPRVEASIYMGAAGRDILALCETINIPVTVMRGRVREGEREGPMDFSASPTWPELATHFRKGTDVYLPEYSHFLAMEAPELVADYVVGRR